LGGSELERVSNKILKRGGGMVSQDTQEARRNGEGVNSSNSLSDILVHKVSQYPINKKRKTEAEVKESSKEVQGEGAGDGGQGGGKDDAEVRSSTRHNLKQRSSQNTAWRFIENDKTKLRTLSTSQEMEEGGRSGEDLRVWWEDRR
jgi:hypothetical protein